MTLENLLLFGFILAMIANAIAFVRHWRMMRMMQIALNGFVEQQREFGKFLDSEQEKVNGLIQRRGEGAHQPGTRGQV